MKLTGTIKTINPTEKFNSGFTKRSIILITNDKYPQEIKIEFTKDNVNKLEHNKEGDFVTVSININGNEYNGKHYVSITGYAIQYER